MRSILMGVMICLAASVVAAEEGKYEVAGTVGAWHLFGNCPETDVALGGRVGVNTSDKSNFFGEFLFVPNKPLDAKSARLMMIGPGYRATVAKSGENILHHVVITGGLVRQTVDFGGYTASKNGGYFGGGYAASLKVAPGWAIRPEIRFQREQGASGGGANTLLIIVGINRRFGRT